MEVVEEEEVKFYQKEGVVEEEGNHDLVAEEEVEELSVHD